MMQTIRQVVKDSDQTRQKRLTHQQERDRLHAKVILKYLRQFVQSDWFSSFHVLTAKTVNTSTRKRKITCKGKFKPSCFQYGICNECECADL